MGAAEVAVECPVLDGFAGVPGFDPLFFASKSAKRQCTFKIREILGASRQVKV
jgi:hypothetical protein